MKRKSLLWCSIITLMAGLAPLSCGGSGGGTSILDPTFGTRGKVTTAIGTFDDGAYALAIQSDRKLVVAGFSYTGMQYEFALVRYNADGSLDTTFNTTGIATTAIGTGGAAYALAIQADGKLVVAGGANTGTQYEFALVRYNTDGSLDTSFNTTGIVTTAIGIVNDQAYALAIQSDGKLVVAGYSYTGTQYEFALVRYNSDGSLDATFNTTGKVTTAIGSINDVSYDLAIQSDGKLVVAGHSATGTQYEFALVRYDTDGSLDTSFNATGIVTTAIGTVDDEAYALAIQSDGKLVVAGYSFNNFALVRYNSDGSLDTTFNTTGEVTTAIGTHGDKAYALAIQLDGKLVAAGTSNTSAGPVIALARYNPDGSLDTTFNTTGKVTTAIGTQGDEALALKIQVDGKLVAAGSSFNATQTVFALARYLP